MLCGDDESVLNSEISGKYKYLSVFKFPFWDNSGYVTFKVYCKSQFLYTYWLLKEFLGL